jgi:putative ABC transport system permease protein
MRWRAGSSIMLLAVAIAAVMAATAGPVYLHAADQSLVTSALEKANFANSGVSLTPETSGQYFPVDRLEAAARSVPGGVGGLGRRFSSAVLTIDSQVNVFDEQTKLPATMQVVFLSGECGDLRIVRGRCPTGPGEVMLSTRTAAAVRVGVGGRVRPTTKKAAAPPLTVSGLYLPGNPAAPRWWGINWFVFGTGTPAHPFLDSGFVTEGQAVQYAGRAPTQDWVDMALRPASISATDVPAALHDLSAWQSHLQTTDGIQVATQLPAVLSVANSEEHSAQTIVAMISLELILLVLLVVYAVARGTSSLREPDVRVAELRGLPRGRVARVALREPAILLLVAVPIGLVLTWIVLAVIDRDVLGPSSATALDSLAIEAAFVGCVAGLLSVALGSRNILGNRRLEATAEETRQRQLRHAAIIDALGVALAVAGVVELVGQSSHAGAAVSPFAYLGPGLVALGAGILASRLLPLVARLASGTLAWSHRATLTLAARSIARRHALTRQVLVPTISTGLLVFAVAGLEVAAANHAMQADFSVGAPVVYDAQPNPGVDLVTAVRRADPSGREAMAVARIASSSGATLAVDSPRFARVASWPATLSPVSAAAVARELKPPMPPARMVPNGSALTLSIDAATSLTPGPDLQMALFDELGEGELDIDFGAIRGGSHTYRASIAGLCLAGCRLDQLLLGWSGPPDGLPPATRQAERKAAANFQMRVLGIAVSGVKGSGGARPVRAGLTRVGAWQGNPALVVTPGPSGLGLDADLLSAGAPSASPVDVPSVLPSVATSELVSLDGTAGNPRGIFALGIDSAQLAAHAATVVPALPAIGNDAAMIDLSFAELDQGGQPQGVTWQVWFHAPPGAALLRRLRSDDVALLARHSATTVLQGIDHTGPSFGFDLYGLAAAGAALLALGALLFSIASDARRRRVEFAGLAAVGVPRRTLLGSLLVESTVLSVAGAIAGTAAAALSAYFALKFLPEFPPGRVGPALQVGVPWLDVVLTGVGMLVVLEAAAVTANLLLVRGVRPDLLRLSL